METYDFGLRLKELREKHGFTQEQVADRLDVTKAAISSWERNIAQPTADTLKTLAVLYRAKADYILGLDNHTYILADGLSHRQLEAVETIISELKNR